MFIPGETITHIFVVPFMATQITKAVITYQQNDKTVLTKTITSNIEPLEDNKSRIVISMTQQESLLFADNNNILIQVNIYMNGTRCTSMEFKTSSGKQHYRKVMTNG